MRKKYIFSLVIAFGLLMGELAFAQKPRTFLPPFHIDKTETQIQKESELGKKHFENILDGDPPPHVDLLKFTTPVKDQGSRGTCVAFAVTGLIESQIKKSTGRDLDLSEQYLYWESKVLGRVLPTTDSSYVLQLLRTIDGSVVHANEEYRGVPSEEAWPYEEKAWYQDKKEHPECYQAAKINEDKIPKVCVTNGSPPLKALQASKVKVIQSQNIPSSPEAITGYIRLGIPVIVALDFYTRAWGFHNYRGLKYLTGQVTTPVKGDVDEGGHAVLIIGYDLSSQTYLFKNSWGKDDWAKNAKLAGFGTIPFLYITKHAIATVAKVALQP